VYSDFCAVGTKENGPSARAIKRWATISLLAELFNTRKSMTRMHSEARSTWATTAPRTKTAVKRFIEDEDLLEDGETLAEHITG
jgi:hypothetical protein